MVRIHYTLGILFLFVQLIIAQDNPIYSSLIKQSSTIELPTPEVQIYNAFRINTSGYEFSPSYYKNGIVYVSTQSEENKSANTPFFELYYAILDEDGMPNHSIPFSSTVNTHRHEGQATFNQSEDVVYYTSNSELKNDNAQYAMKIYEARKKGEDWLHVVDLPFNSETYSNRHPSISTNGKYLYFASDMPGGYGGTDIYVVEKKGTQWGIPKNLGDQINTPENDAFPFIHANEHLFFSSKGHGGKGDYDIFVVNLSGGIPGPIMHLSNSFNSPQADIGFILNDESTKGFFASDRVDGFGNDDIYLFESSTNLFAKEVVSVNPDIVPTSETEIIASNSIIEESIPNHPVELLVEKKNVSTPIDETPKKIVPPVVVAEKIITEEVIAAPISIKQNSNIETKVNSSLQVGNCSTLKGQALSQNGTAIAQGKITIRSSKGGMPLELLTNQNGTFEACLPFDCQYIIIVEKDGYQTKDRLITINQEPTTEEALQLNIDRFTPVVSIPTTHLDDHLTVGSVIELNPIYYDLENGTVNANNTAELDALAQMMRKYKSIEIELIDHTDARGEDFFNQQLSQARISIAKNHLIQQGRIAPRRINAIAMGEQQIRNHCKNNISCEDEAHQYNRRTEVRIIRIVEAEQVWFAGGKL